MDKESETEEERARGVYSIYKPGGAGKGKEVVMEERKRLGEGTVERERGSPADLVWRGNCIAKDLLLQV